MLFFFLLAWQNDVVTWFCWQNFKVLSVQVTKIFCLFFLFVFVLNISFGTISLWSMAVNQYNIMKLSVTFLMIVLNLSLSVFLLWNQSAYKVLWVIFQLKFPPYFFCLFLFLNSWSHSTTTKVHNWRSQNSILLLSKICSNNDKK